MIAVLVPVLGRPERAAPLVESVQEASSGLATRVLFLVTPGDEDQRRAAESAGGEVVVVPFDLAPGDYARKINHGIAVTSEPWVLQGADDLAFHPGWAEAALETGERRGAGVVGTNDLGNPLVMRGRHATHSLARRTYVLELGTADEPGKLLHEGYGHCWVDNELVETAQARGAWAFSRRSHVEHLHHVWPDGRGGRKGRDDATYQRGQSTYRVDHRLFLSRRPLWTASRAVR